MAPKIGQDTIQDFGTTFVGMFDSNKTKDQKIQSGYNFFADLALKTFFDNASEEARATVDENNQINNDLNTATQTQAEANKQALETITNEIKQNQAKITEILEKITDFEEEKEDINKEVEQHQKELDKQIQNFENATSAKEKRDALDAISTENTAVKDLLAKVTELGKEQEKLNEQGDEYQALNGNLEQESEETKTDGEEKINALKAQGVANETYVTGTVVAQGAKYTAKGLEYAAMAAAARSGGALTGLFSFGAGAAAGEAAAAKYTQLAENNFAAATIISGGVPDILSTIGNVFDGTNTNLGYLTNTSSTIGSLTAAANGDVESFFGISNSLGSWLDGTESWEATNESIDNEVETESEEIADDATDNSQDGDDVTEQNGQKKKFGVDADYSTDVA